MISSIINKLSKLQSDKPLRAEVVDSYEGIAGTKEHKLIPIPFYVYALRQIIH